MNDSSPENNEKNEKNRDQSKQTKTEINSSNQIPKDKTKEDSEKDKKIIIKPLPDLKYPTSLVYGGWTTCSTSEVPVRTKKYLKTKRKGDKTKMGKNQIPPFELVGMEIMKQDENNDQPPQRIAEFSQSYFHGHIKHDAVNNPHVKYFLVNNMVSSLKVGVCSFWRYDQNKIKKSHPKFLKLWEEFMAKDDEFRNSRFKLYATISGSVMLDKMLPRVPTLLGNKVPITYIKGENYFELDVMCDQNTAAYGIIKLAHKWSTSLMVDLNLFYK
eukprot:UN28042